MPTHQNKGTNSSVVQSDNLMLLKFTTRAIILYNLICNFNDRHSHFSSFEGQMHTCIHTNTIHIDTANKQ